MQLYLNNWATTTAAEASAAALEILIAPADAAKLVGLGTGDHYLLTLIEQDGAGTEIDWEVVKVTAVSGVTGALTIDPAGRGLEGTAARLWPIGTSISLRVTAGGLEALRDSGGADLSDAAPQALGAASAGVSEEASRADHVHDLPTPADIGAATAAQGALAESAVQPDDLSGLIATTEKGAANGVATLDAGGLVPAAQLPSYVDDVLEYADLASLPGTGETGKIYVTLDNSRQYRWSGSAYVELVASPGTTDNVPEGSTNLYHTAARVRDAVLTGLSLATSTAVAATDSVLVAIGKLAARLSLKEQTLTAGSNVTIDRTDPENPIISASITGGGGGDVVGPASAVANEAALFDGITGKLLKGGGLLGTAAAADTGDFATAAEGALAAAAIPSSEKGAANGVATLDAGGLVPSAQLPSYVDDVLEYADLASLPGTGETGKIYVTLDSSRQYRWSGSAYVELVASPGTTDNVPEGSTNLYHTAARVRDTVLTGFSLADTAVVAAADSVLQAIGKLAGRLALAFDRANHTGSQAISTVTGLQTALDGKAATTTARTISGTSGTLVPADAGNIVLCTSASAVSLTIQLEATAAWPAASVVTIIQLGTGIVTVTDGSGITVNVFSGLTKALRGQYAQAALARSAADTFALAGLLGGTPA